jgi:integrase
METTFKIRRKNDKEQYILLVINHKYQRYSFSTPYSILSADWGKGYPKEKNTTKQLRDNLDVLKVKMDKYITDTINDQDRVPSQNEIKERIKVILGKQEKTDLKSVYKNYLEMKKPTVKTVTIDQIEVSFTHFFDYSFNAGFEDLNLSFSEKWIEYLRGKPQEPVTINKHLKNIKTFLNWCYLRDYTQKNLSKYFKKLSTQDKEIIAITQSELKIIEDAVLDSRLDKIRDLFLFSCYTGLRYGDVSKLEKDMITDDMLKMQQQKVSSFVSIPLLSKPLELLKKYNYELPVISNQKANDYLKDLFADLKLKRVVYNEKKKKLTPLHEAITFHIGRKSFITLALTAGVNPKVVQKISGHKKSEVFDKYIAFASTTLTDELSKMEQKKEATPKE